MNQNLTLDMVRPRIARQAILTDTPQPLIPLAW